MQPVRLQKARTSTQAPAARPRSAVARAAIRGGLMLGAGVLSALTAVSSARAQPLAATPDRPGPDARPPLPAPLEQTKWALLAEVAAGGLAAGVLKDKRRYAAEYQAVQKRVPDLRATLRAHAKRLVAWEATRAAAHAGGHATAGRIADRMLPSLARETRLLALEARHLEDAGRLLKGGPRGYSWTSLFLLREGMDQLSNELNQRIPFRTRDLERLRALSVDARLAPDLLRAAAEGAVLPTFSSRQHLERLVGVLRAQPDDVTALGNRIHAQLASWLESARSLHFAPGVQQLESLLEACEEIIERPEAPDPYAIHEDLLGLEVFFPGLATELDRVEALSAYAKDALEYVAILTGTLNEHGDGQIHLDTVHERILSGLDAALKRGDFDRSAGLLLEAVGMLERLTNEDTASWDQRQRLEALRAGAVGLDARGDLTSAS